jgi:hypothetical protein
MRGDGWLKLLDPYSLKGLESTVLVHPDQARVARHIGGKNGGQPAFDAFRGQAALPYRMGRLDYRLPRRTLTVNARAGIPFRRGRLQRSARCAQPPPYATSGETPGNSAGAMERSNKNASPLWQSNPAKPVRENGPISGGW